MNLIRIFGMVLRYVYFFRRSYDRLSDMFYWPTVDLVLWGVTSVYFRSYLPNASQVVVMIVSGILLWIIVWRGQYEITVNLLEELWNRNLINLFASPLTFWEWICSLLIIGVIKGLLSLIFALVVALILYKIQIFFYGLYLLPFLILLIMSGWWVGFFIAGLILRFGTRVQAFAWTAVMLISPFSAIYYPVSILPQWAQIISRFIPTSYIFEGAREILFQGTLDPNKLIASFLLNCAYLSLSLLFLHRSFKVVLRQGLKSVY